MKATLKLKKCRNPKCRAEFMQARSMQTVCGIKCAQALTDAKKDRDRKAKDKIERAERKAAKEKIKRKADYAKEAQDAFNTYIRERDHDLPCISCGTTADVQYAAGHYRTVGACKELRFEPLNVHKQCNRNCNQGKSGNIVEYRINLVKKIGAEAVEWLEGPHEPKRYTIEDLQAIKAEYRAKTRELRRAQA